MQLEGLAFKSVPSRLAAFLLQLVEKHGDAYPQWIINQMKLTHQDIARLIGAERETVSKHLNQFKRAGALDYNRRRLFILDRALLERIATGTTELVYEILGPY